MSDGGGLPRGWAWTNLSEIGYWAGGGTPSKSNDAYWTNGTVPWVSPKDVKRLRLSSTEDQITDLAVEETVVRKVPPGSIVIVVRSGILSHTLPIALLDVEATVNQDIRVLVPDSALNVEWLLYALLAQSEDIRRSCQKDGTTVASIDVPSLAKWRLALPPRSEQDKIVAEIERLRSELHAADDELRVARSDLKRLRQSTLNKLVQGHPQEPLGDLATDWRYGTSVKCTASAEGPPVLRIPNIQHGAIDKSDMKYATVGVDELGACVVEPGDLLFVRTNGSRDLIGRIGRVQQEEAGFGFASYLIRARPSSRLLPDWAVIALSAPELRAEIERLAASTAGQYNLNLASLRSLRIPLPDPATQERLIDVAARWTRSAVEVARDLDDASRLAQQLDHALLRQAQEGALVAQDAKDEPAHELLERVRQSRAARSEGGRSSRSRRKQAGARVSS